MLFEYKTFLCSFKITCQFRKFLRVVEFKMAVVGCLKRIIDVSFKQFCGFGSALILVGLIRIRIHEGNQDTQRIKRVRKNFKFWSVGYSLLMAGGFCSLNVLHGGLRINILQFLMKKIHSFLFVKFTIFVHLFPGLNGVMERGGQWHCSHEGSVDALKWKVGSGFALKWCRSATLIYHIEWNYVKRVWFDAKMGLGQWVQLCT